MKLLEVTYATNHPFWMKTLVAVIVMTACAVPLGLIGPYIAKLGIFNAVTIGALFGATIGQDILHGLETRRLRRIIRDAGLDENVNH